MWNSNPCKGKRFISSPKRSEFLEPTQSPVQGYLGIFPGGKVAGADESTAPRAAVDNQWSHTSTLLLIYTGV
jgi:hypothetical protein